MERDIVLKSKVEELKNEIKLEKERKKDLKQFIREEQAEVRKEQAERQRKFLEQIKLDVCYNKNKILLLSAGGTCDYTDLGPTHHCPSDISVIDNYPHISWFLPFNSDQSELKVELKKKKASSSKEEGAA